jgi:HK97 family phage prohead protease
MRETTVDLPVLSRAAMIKPGSVDEERRTVELVWTTGAPVLRGFFERYWEELSLEPKHVRMKRLNNGAPLLNAHDDSDVSRVIGVVESARLEEKRGVAVVRFARAEDDPAADAIFRKVKDGIIQNISVGYRTYKAEKVEESADKIPVFRAVDWEPYELSVVPMGADDGAGFRGADRETNQCVFVTRQEKAMKDDGLPTTEPKESPAAAATRAANDARLEERKRLAEARQAASEEAIEQERARSSGIRRVAKQASMGEEWAARLIEAGTTVEEARTEAFNEMARRNLDEWDPSPDGPRIGAGDDERDKFVRGASAWLFQRTGMRFMLEAAKRKDPDRFKDLSFDPGEFRGYAPVELARLCLERQGVKTRGMDRMQMIGLAFTHRGGNYQTAGDFPTLLENVLGKVLLGAYATQENTWQRFCKIDEVPDFRTSNRYRTGSLPGLDVIAEHGEYTNGIVPDGAKYPVLTQRLGKIFGISRETILNDDMSALTDMAMKMGQAAMRTIETSVYTLISANSGLGPTQGDAQPFFHANRSNVNATGSAISVAGLDADRVILRAQKDPSGLDYLDLTPAVLLVPDSLRGTALQLNEAQFDPASSKFQVPNMVRGLFREVVGTPRLSGTRRYLIADPLDWIVVAFLEGYGRGPAMESRDGWRIDGTEWKVTLYAKAQMGDAKVAVTNAGQ